MPKHKNIFGLRKIYNIMALTFTQMFYILTFFFVAGEDYEGRDEEEREVDEDEDIDVDITGEGVLWLQVKIPVNKSL